MRKELGWAGSVRLWIDAGRFIRQNAWQLFYLVDIIRQYQSGSRDYPCLKLYDQRIAELLNFRMVDGFFGVLSFIWVMGVLNLFCRINNRLPNV